MGFTSLVKIVLMSFLASCIMLSWSNAWCGKSDSNQHSALAQGVYFFPIVINPFRL